MENMTITATKIFEFAAGHCLPGHTGLCANLHGHNYKLEVTVTRGGACLKYGGSSDGMITDFSDLKNIVVKNIVEPLDHANLNEVLSYRPTAENMVMDIFQRLDEILRGTPITVVRVRLWETSTSYAEVTIND